ELRIEYGGLRDDTVKVLTCAVLEQDLLLFNELEAVSAAPARRSRNGEELARENEKGHGQPPPLSCRQQPAKARRWFCCLRSARKREHRCGSRRGAGRE